MSLRISKKGKRMERQMKKVFFVSFLFITFSFNINCQSAVSPSSIGRELFNSIKASSNSNNDKFSSLFLKREDGNLLYREIAAKAPQRGVNDWTKIEYVDYVHKEFMLDGINYSSGCLVVKLNGTSDYYFLGFYLLSIQVGKSYKILEAKDNWSRDSTVPWDVLHETLDYLKDWL
jgi:hypothetical protein